MSTETNTKQIRNAPVGGVILIIIGLGLFLAQFVDWPDNFGIYIPLVIGLVLGTWGVLNREAGLIIPGGIMSGIGTGILAIEGPLASTITRMEVDDGGVFMLFFAVGWVSITVLTALFTDKIHWWPLIPATIMAFIGSAILFGGIAMMLLATIGRVWPLILVAIGVVVLWEHFVRRKEITD